MRRAGVRMLAWIAIVATGGSTPAGAQCLAFGADVVDFLGGPVLEGAFDVAVAPDGEAIYVAANAESALAIFERNPVSGALQFSSAFRDGVAGVDGLAGPITVATSPDGRHVYVTGGDGLAVFAKLSTSVDLDFVESHGNAEIGFGFDVAVSPDGRHVYVADGGGNGIVTYARNASTGVLTHVDDFADGEAGAPLAGASGVAVSPDGAHVYAVASNESSFVHFTRNATTGALTFAGADVDGAAGVDGLTFVDSIAVSPDGRHVYAGANDELAIFARTGETVSFQEAVKNGIGGVTLQEARDLEVSSDGLRVFVVSTDLNDAAPDGVVMFARDPVTGSLRQVDARGDGPAPEDRLLGAQGLGASPDGRSLYVASFTESAVTRYDFPNLLREVQVLRDGENGVDGLDGASVVATSQDRRFVYVAGFDEDAIAVFERDGTNGTLSFVELERNGLGGVAGLDGPQGLAVSPDDAHLYATALNSSAVVVFSRNRTTGQLTYVGSLRDGIAGVDGIGGTGAVLVSPDGADVYVGGYNDDAIAHFSRNATTGSLSYVSAIFDGQGLADGLEGAGGTQMAMDAAGRHLYVPGSNEGALTVFERDAVTGALSFVQTLRNGQALAPLDFANAALLSPDGGLLYVTALLDSAFTIFARDASLGVLDVLDVERDGIGGVTGLTQPRSLARNASGSRIYAAAQSSDSVAVFDHDLQLGSTSFAGALADGDCFEGLDLVASLAAADPFVYAASYLDDAIVVLAPEPLGPSTGLAAAVALLMLARRSRERR